jgi:PAS domain S-box-containing protein
MTPAIRTALEMMEKTFSLTGEGFFAFDGNCRCLMWNAVMEKISGYQRNTVLGLNIPDLFPFLKDIGENQYFSEALNGKTVATSDRIYTIPENGKTGFFDAFYFPVYDENKKVILCGAAVLREKTSQKVTEKKAGELESRFKRMADNSPVLLWMAGTDGLCNFFNQTWLDFSGRPLEDELNVGWAEAIHFEDFQYCVDTYLRAFKKREVFEMEYRLRRHDGEYRWILDRGTPRFDDEGKFAGYIGSCIDITDRKIVEQDLKKAVDSRDEFLSIASHELKTPLTSLKLQLQISKHLLVEKPWELDTARFSKTLEVSEKQTDRLTSLVENLLDVSRIRSSRLQPNYENFDLVSLIKEVVERMRTQPAQVVNLNLPASLNGLWDKNNIDQVLVNLLSNALKFGNGKPVTVALAGTAEKTVITVTDQGIGIDPQVQSHIFDRFERGVSSEHYAGLGLGLYIVKRIVEAHDGKVGVESVPGKGATFTVEIPLHHKEQTASQSL